MAIPYISSRRKRIEELEEENIRLKNRIKFLENKLKAYGYNPERETLSPEKSEGKYRHDYKIIPLPKKKLEKEHGFSARDLAPDVEI